MAIGVLKGFATGVGEDDNCPVLAVLVEPAFEFGESLGWDADFAFTQDVGKAFNVAYPAIVKKNMNLEWSAEQREEQSAEQRAKRRAKGKARREGFILPAPMIWRSGAKNGGSSAQRANQQGRNITGHDTSGSLCHAFPLHIGVVRRSSFVRHRWC